jgi:hypothetical protein
MRNHPSMGEPGLWDGDAAFPQFIRDFGSLICAIGALSSKQPADSGQWLELSQYFSRVKQLAGLLPVP